MERDDPAVAEFLELKQHFIACGSSVVIDAMCQLARYEEKEYITTYYDRAKMVTRGKIQCVVLYPEYAVQDSIVKLKCAKPDNPILLQEIHALFRSLDIQFTDGVSNYRPYVPHGRSEEQRRDAQYMLDKIVTNDTGYMSGVIGLLEYPMKLAE